MNIRVRMEFRHFVITGENNKRNLSFTKNGNLLSFLEDPISPLCISNLPVCSVFNPLDLNLSSPHV
ncbi:hypothetical protein ACHQM5_016004 [Ranunculus cassubicifolius]